MKELKELHKPYLTTRPTLAAILMDKGYKAKTVQNPYDTQRIAWLFNGADAQLSRIVSDYYGKIKAQKKKGPHHEN